MLSIRVDDNAAGQVICLLVGELDLYAVPRFRQTLAQLPSGSRVLIDVSDVAFVDSAVLPRLPAARPNPDESRRSLIYSNVSSSRGRMMLTTMLRGTFASWCSSSPIRGTGSISRSSSGHASTLPYRVFRRSA